MNSIISSLISVILGQLSGETFRKVIDGLLDKVEESVIGSSNKIDDIVVLPLCKKVRELLNVPDDDDVN